MTRGFALFATAVGPCGIAWGDGGIVGVNLPEGDEAATRDRLRRRFAPARECAPPPEVQQAIDAIVALLRGERVELAGIRLDMRDVPPFQRRVYEAAREIAPGSTLSYGDIARRLGDPGAARSVGHALGRNPFTIVVPCHGVLAAGDKPGGFSAYGGVTTKLQLLAIEGALGNEPGLFDAESPL
ncbi:MAG TPA: methylated-DNA--[protein]-cysteine S-methyltransferase [Albitalea sp.]|nr:methylated-DNA--[protein]-cysteine S-methyltransferase [Albitalea sp.]